MDIIKREEFAKISSLRTFKKKSFVILENEIGKMFYIIYSGRIKITKIGLNGNEVILSILESGDFFGEMSIIDNIERSANAMTISDAQLLAINDRDFMYFVRNYPNFAINLLKTFTIRLRYSDISIKSLSLDDSQKKVLLTLNSLAEQIGILKEGNVILPDLPPQTDLASLSGTSRETLSRVLKKLESDQIIEKIDKDIIIKNYHKFKENFIENE